MDALYVGLMSGTSADGVDAALVGFDSDGLHIVGTRCDPMPPALRERLLGLTGESPLHEVMSLDMAMADRFAASVRALLEQTGTPASDVRAIGNHGQTIWHSPTTEPRTTVQIGDPNRIAEITGIDVVADFRRRDMAAGGEGAPLAPAFHQAVLRRNDRTRVILNLGGMANITVLPKDRSQPILGFDCGPGNALQDRWAEHHGRGPMDADGQWAASGAVQPALLRRLMDDPYFHRSPPKSSGPEYFNLRWLRPMLSDESPADVQATLAALSVETIAAAVRESAPQAQQLLVCGGGVHNRFVMTQLDAALSDVEVVSTAAAGLDPDYVEAIAFAWLAYRTVEGLPGNEPAVTGASHAAVLGGLYQGRGRGRTEGLKG